MYSIIPPIYRISKSEQQKFNGRKTRICSLSCYRGENKLYRQAFPFALIDWFLGYLQLLCYSTERRMMYETTDTKGELGEMWKR
jgi:hypothetical protein